MMASEPVHAVELATAQRLYCRHQRDVVDHSRLHRPPPSDRLDEMTPALHTDNSQQHRCNKRFLRFFLFRSRFLRFLTFFFIFSTFFIFKKRCQMQSMNM